MTPKLTMKLTAVPIEELKIKYYQYDDDDIAEENEKKRLKIDNGLENYNEIIKQCQAQLDSIFDREIDFYNDFHAVRRLLQLQGKKAYADSDVFFPKLERKIKTVLAEKYNLLRRMPLGDSYPVITLFHDAWKEIKPYETIFYLKYHGLSNIKNNKYLKKFSMWNLEDIKVFDSLGYPVTEIFYIFAQIYSEYIKFENDRLKGVTDHSDLINKTYLQIQDSLKVIVYDGNKDDINKYATGLKELQDFGSVIGKINDEIDISRFIQDCYIKGSKKIVGKLCSLSSEEDYGRFFFRFGEMLDTCKSINKALDEMAVTKIDVRHFAVLAQSETMYLIKSLTNVIYEAYYLQDIGKLMKVVELCYGSGNMIGLDWEIVENKIYTELLAGVEMPNEDKLKEMVRYFDNVNDIVRKLSMFKAVIQMQPRKVSRIFCENWNKDFKRDVPNHLVFYLDYKLKNMVKFKDRNKFEIELEKVVNLMKFLLQPLSRNDKIKFRKKYLSLYLQRMINSLYDDDFPVFINICDCESEMAKQLDSLYAAQSIFEIMFSKIHQEVIHSHDIFEKIRSEMAAGETVKIIGMKKIEELGGVNEEADSGMKIDYEIVKKMKEYKQFLKKELRDAKMLIDKNTKVKLELSFGYSRFDLQYGDVLIDCNMYQYMMLSLFNDLGSDEEAINEDRFLKKLMMSKKTFNKQMGALCSSKHPVLIKCEDGWKINTEFEKDIKFKKNVAIK